MERLPPQVREGDSHERAHGGDARGGAREGRGAQGAPRGRGGHGGRGEAQAREMVHNLMVRYI